MVTPDQAAGDSAPACPGPGTESAPDQALPPLVSKRNRRRILLGVLACFVLLAGYAWHSFRSNYPYGSSHCCILGMASALEQYADDNAGKYPAGQPTAEASLSLLYKSNYTTPYMLRGMIVSESTVRRVLDAGQLLGPDSCGWHYVPRLNKADNPRLALLWCKQPLGHNGQKTKSGGRQVVFVSGSTEWISGANWPAFLKEQSNLLSHRTAREVNMVPLVTGIIELPGGRRINQIDGSYTIAEESKGPDTSSSGTETTSGLKSVNLIWYQPPLQNGSVTHTLSFSNMISDPVTIRFTNGVPDVTNYAFKMRVKP